MSKKIFALILVINCMNAHCKQNITTSETIAVAQIKAAGEALQRMDQRTSRAYMGGTIAGIGAAGFVMTLLLNGNTLMLGACGTATVTGSIVALTSQNGDPQERARLITIIENAGNSEPTNNKNSILADNDK
jgi:hypothetical protein